MTPHPRTVGATAVFCLVATLAAAQTTPPAPRPPTPVSDAPAPPPPDPQEVQPPRDQSRTPAWAVSAAASAVYESDVNFNGTPENGDWSQQLQARLSRSFALRRGSVSANAGLSHLSYPQHEELDRLSYDFSAGASYALTRRLSLTASDMFANSYAQDSRLLIRAGQLFPRAITRTNAASGNLSYLLTRSTTIGGSVSSTNVFFEDPSFVGGSGLSAQGTFSKQINERQALGVLGGYTVSDGSTGDIRSLMGTWQGAFGRTVRVSGMAGVRAYSLEGEGRQRYSPGGSFGITATVARYHAVGVNFESLVEQAFGYGGTYLTQRVSGSYAASIGPLTLTSTASYSDNQYLDVEGLRRGGRNLAFDARYALASQLLLGADYEIWTRTETGSPALTTYRTGITVTYAFGW